jgi:NtrC-family two-component system sensor histidine kinase KinB
MMIPISLNSSSWLYEFRKALLRSLIVFGSFVLVGWLSFQPFSTSVWLGLIVYGAIHILLFIGANWFPYPRSHAHYTYEYLPLLCDMIFVVVTLNATTISFESIVPLCVLLALRCASAQNNRTIAYFVVLASLAFVSFRELLSLTLPARQAVWWMTLLGVVATMFAVLFFQQRKLSQMRRIAISEQKLHAQQLEEAERFSVETRGRLRDYRMLEESVRLLSSTLDLADVLAHTVDGATRLLGRERLQAMFLSQPQGQQWLHAMLPTQEQVRAAWLDLIVDRTIEAAVPQLIGDILEERDYAWIKPEEVRSVLALPLYVGDKPVHGVLVISSSQVFAYSSGDVRLLAGFALQVSIALHNAELHSRLHYQQQLLHSVIQNSNDGLLVLNDQLGLVLANPVARAAFGLPTMQGVSVLECLHCLAETLLADTAAARMTEIQVICDSPEDTCAYEALASLVLAPDQGALVAIVLHDVSEQKAEAKLRSEFISMVSHELRNPLNSLNGFVKLVLQGRAGELTSLQQEFLEVVDEQVETLKSRITELLSFNKMDAGRLSLNPSWGDLHELVQYVVVRLTVSAEQIQVTLRNELPIDLPECYFDRSRIAQVLTNLLENALKATPTGGIVWVTAEAAEDGTEVWVSVHDTGVGIPIEEQPKIFERFYQLQNAQHHNLPHLGLGLAICQQIVEGHHGRLWVVSEGEGRGSCFTFSLQARPHELMLGI